MKGRKDGRRVVGTGEEEKKWKAKGREWKEGMERQGKVREGKEREKRKGTEWKESRWRQWEGKKKAIKCKVREDNDQGKKGKERKEVDMTATKRLTKRKERKGRLE